MSKFTPEQKQVIDYRGDKLLVSASAGTGKTTVMIQRILSLIEEGADISQFIVVTFTNLAATEMKNRLAAELSKIQNNPRISDQLERLDMATISTMHSFCSDLLRNYFYVADIDPSFSVLDDITVASLRENCLDDLFKQYFAEKDPIFVKVHKIFSSGRQEDNFRDTLRKLYNFSQRLENFDEWYAQKRKNFTEYSKDNPIVTTLLNNVSSEVLHYKRNYEQLTELCMQENSPLKSYCEQIAQSLDFPLNDLQQTVNALLCVTIPTLPRSKAAKDSADVDIAIAKKIETNCKQLRTQFGKLQEYYGNLFRNMSLDDLWQQTAETVVYTDKLVEILHRFDELFFQAKKQRGGIDFDDLEHLALDVLKNPEAAEEIRSRYKYVFVDEYQDTSPIQESLVKAIAAENLFMVGDVKQSIYGFRGCEPSIFMQKYNSYNNYGQGKAVKLNDNFRTNNEIFTFVNALFAQTMTQNFGMIDYATEAMLKGPCPPVLTTPAVNIDFVIPPAKQKKPAEGIYDITNVLPDSDEVNSAQIIADNIRNYIGMVYKDNDGLSRRIEYSDIVILLRSMSGKTVDLYNCLLNNNIPVVASFKTDSYANKEIRDLINLLRVTDNPYNELYLVGTCLSCFGKMTESELGQIRLETGGRMNFYERFAIFAKKFPDSPVTQKIYDLTNLIEKVRFFSHGATVCETAMYVIKLTNYHLYVQGLPNGSLRLNKLYAFTDKLKDASFAQSVDKFLSFLDESDRETADEAPEAGNAVRIMTMHASKGLEFPVVIVADLDRKFNLRPTAIRFNVDLGVATDHYDFVSMKKAPTLGMTACTLVNDQKQREEELRILYVALTRAKFVLNIVATASEKALNALPSSPQSANRHLDWIIDTVNSHPEWLRSSGQANKSKHGAVCIRLHDKPSVRAEFQPNENELLCKQYDDKQACEGLNYRYPYADQSDMPLKVVSSAIETSFATQTDDDDESDDMCSFVTLCDSAEQRNKVGTAYHKVLQMLPFDATDEQIRQAILQVCQNLPDVCAEQLQTNVIAAVIQNKQLQQACKGKLYKEIPFMLQVPYNLLSPGSHYTDQVMLQGVIDLLAVDGDSATVVDYKYTAHSDQVKQNYASQLNSYKIAVQKILGVSSVKCFVMSVADGKLISMD